MPTTETEPASDRPTYSSQYSHSYPVLPSNGGESQTSSFQTIPSATHEERTSSLTTPNPKYSHVPSRTISTEPSYYMSLNSPYPESNTRPTRPMQTVQQSFPGVTSSLSSSQIDAQPSAYNYSMPSATAEHPGRNPLGSGGPGPDLPPPMDDANGMMIGSHDVDMNALHNQESFPFVNGEILPWLEYLPQDVLSFFGEHQNFPLMSPDDVSRPS